MSAPFNTVYASSIWGVVLDCNVNTGLTPAGGTPTDNTVALNNFLATATPTNPIRLIIDGGSIITGLHIATLGHTTIEGTGWDSGFFMKAGSNSTAIDNGPIPGTIPGVIGSNVQFINFQINGNRGNGTTGNCTSGDPRAAPGGAWKMNIWLANVSNIVFDRMLIWDSPTYSVNLLNCSNIEAIGCMVYNPNTTPTLNNDCFHFDGPGTWVRIIGNYIGNNFSDDGVAINAPEGYAGGVLDQFIVSNNNFAGCLHAVRMYGATDQQVSAVQVTGNTGITTENVVLLGVFNGVAAGDINCRTVNISNNTFAPGKRFIEIDGGCGDVNIFNNTWYGESGTAAAFIYIATPCHISALRTGNNAVYRETNFNNTIPLLVSNSAATTIDYMSINGYYLLAKQGFTGSGLANALVMTSITITRLHVTALDFYWITALASDYTNISILTGPILSSQTSSKTTAYTLLPTDGTIFVDCTGGAVSITLPAKQYPGHVIEVQKIDASANVVTLVGTIAGAVNPTLAAQYSKAKIGTSGTLWYNV